MFINWLPLQHVPTSVPNYENVWLNIQFIQYTYYNKLPIYLYHIWND